MKSEKICKRCEISKPLTEFSARASCRDGLDTHCKSCKSELTKAYYLTHKEHCADYGKIYYAVNQSSISRRAKEWRESHKEKTAEYSKKYYQAHKRESMACDIAKNYGISIDQYEAMLLEQNGVCAICHKAPDKRRLNIDHDHKTGLVRGLLCIKCNRAIGLLKDDTDLLQSAINYLKKGE
jgi:hypothetical protein